MNKIPGAKPVALSHLVRVQDRITFIYLEHHIIHRENNSITAQDADGITHIPAATIGALLLGPGTTMSQQAMMLLAESGATTIWVGERGVRYYAHGRPLTNSSYLLRRQAELVSHRSSRLQVARQMYAQRFPEEDVSSLTRQQLLGREGARVRQLYRLHSQRTGVPWDRREYDHTDFDSGTAINQALSAAHACLYGVVHAVVVALGCSPGLGFIHTGKANSFVHDMADLYKADVTIPIAFDVAASAPLDIGSTTRRAVRDCMKNQLLLEKCSRDIKKLFSVSQEELDNEIESSLLWGDGNELLPGGVSYES